MIIETKVHTCRKCQSEDLVKNGTNASGSPLYHCKTCGAYGVLEPRDGYTQEEKEIIIKTYQERASMRGIERIYGVCRQTLSAWLEEKADALPPLEETLQPVDSENIPVLKVDELWSFVFRSKDKVWVWIAMNRLVPVDNSLIFINFMNRLRAKRTDSLTNRFFLLSIRPV